MEEFDIPKISRSQQTQSNTAIPELLLFDPRVTEKLPERASVTDIERKLGEGAIADFGDTTPAFTEDEIYRSSAFHPVATTLNQNPYNGIRR